MILFWPIVWLAFLCQSVQIMKSFSASQFRTNKGWIFLGRQKVGIKNNVVSLQIDFQKAFKGSEKYELELLLIGSDTWQQQKQNKCQRKYHRNNIQNAKNSQKVTNFPASFSLILSIQNQFKQHLQISLPLQFSQTVNLILRDCDSTFVNQYFEKQNQLSINLRVISENSFVGSDQFKNVFILPFLILLGIYFLLKLQKKSQKDYEKEPSPLYKWLRAALLINSLALTSKFISFMFLFVGGSELQFMEYFYLIFHSLSESIVICGLILLAFGWTIIHQSQDEEYYFYIPFSLMVGIISCVFVALGSKLKSEHQTYHMYDSFLIFILIGYRILGIFGFVIGCLMQIFNKNHSQKVKYFMMRLLIFGFLYIGLMPSIVLAAEFLDYFDRKYFVFVATEITKSFLNFVFIKMIADRKSDYRSLSLDNKTFME